MAGRLAVVVLTRDEALHIGRALASVAPVADELFVVDCGSRDATVEIARAAGASVVHHPWTNYARQFQWALDHLPITADWVMRLDADEVVAPELAIEIAARLPLLPADITGVNLKRRHIFMGRWIRHGGRYPLILLRIWRRGAARIEDRWMDEHMVLTRGRAVTFAGGFSDFNLRGLAFFTAKHDGYATREAVDVLGRRLGLFGRDPPAAIGASRQARLKRAIKERVYDRLPFGAGAALYFLWRYVARLGFLDGREGAIYHALQGGWYRFLVAAKVEELTRAIGDARGPAALAILAERTGLSLAADQRAEP